MTIRTDLLREISLLEQAAEAATYKLNEAKTALRNYETTFAPEHMTMVMDMLEFHPQVMKGATWWTEPKEMHLTRMDGETAVMKLGDCKNPYEALKRCADWLDASSESGARGASPAQLAPEHARGAARPA